MSVWRPLLDVKNDHPSWFPPIPLSGQPRSPLPRSTSTHSSGVTPSDPELRPIHVLLADEADADATAVRELLDSRRAGYRLTRVRAVAELPAELRRGKVDLVLLALELGDMLGIAAVRQARAVVDDVPIVVLTRASDAKVALACIEAGAEDFVTKDELAPALLDRAIRHAVGRSRARDIDTWLEHSNRLTALGTLAAGVAHEVNNPATVAVMSAGLVQERLEALAQLMPEAGARAIIEETLGIQRDLLEGLDRIRAAIKNVQSFARPQEGPEELIDVAVLCRSARRIVAGELKDRARYRERLGACGAVRGDARQLEQVLVNLLINAAHAIPPGDASSHTVSVEAQAQADSVVIVVSDTGGGIPEEILPRIFDPFFTTKPRERGSGLGLWICSRIVARMGGQIRVSTQLGLGSRFEIELPLVSGIPGRASTGDLLPRRVDGRVLVIDDDAQIRRTLGRALGTTHAVVEADGGAEALAILRRDRAFDVILCDISMPDVDGKRVVAAVRAAAPELVRRFVMMTGNPHEPEHDALASLTGHLILAKPIDVPTLRRAVERAAAEAQGSGGPRRV